MDLAISTNVDIHITIIRYNILMNFEYPIYPDRTYRIDVDGEKHYITGANLIAIVLDKLNEE